VGGLHVKGISPHLFVITAILDSLVVCCHKGMDDYLQDKVLPYTYFETNLLILSFSPQVAVTDI